MVCPRHCPTNAFHPQDCPRKESQVITSPEILWFAQLHPKPAREEISLLVFSLQGETSLPETHPPPTTNSSKLPLTLHACVVLSHSVVSNSFVTPWPGASQAPLSMGSPRQEHWSGFPYPPAGDLYNPETELRSPTLHADSLPSEPPGKPKNTGVGSLSLLQGISQPRNRTRVSCSAGGFFTS